MELVDGGITAPTGFLAAGVAAGVKKQGKDVAVIYSEKPAHVAAVFTTNVVKAAPVLLSQRAVSQGHSAQAIVVNSGNANACTGAIGLVDAEKMCQKAAQSLNLQPSDILVASTGVIGVPLPIDVVAEGIASACSELGSSRASASSAAEAIMTTDTGTKEVAVALQIDGCRVVIGGMSKGSGMIHPNMATMLGFITTDVNIDPVVFQEILSSVVKDTFNMISVDGDMSTNDTVFALANGTAGNHPIDNGHPDYYAFVEAFQHVCTSLAKQIVRDGEGATKLLEVEVSGASTKESARMLAQSILNSSLVKTAFFGADANWGRILAAMGYSGAQFNPDTVSISFASAAGSISLMVKGEPQAFDEGIAKKILSESDIYVQVELDGGGEAKATGWGCDLSYEYVRINGDYRS